MSIGFYPRPWNLTHGQFHALRVRLAEGIGLRLEQMEGFGGTRTWEGVTDPLLPLLLASDVEGRLTPQECWSVKRRIQEIIDSWDPAERSVAMQMAEYLAQAAVLGETVSWLG